MQDEEQLAKLQMQLAELQQQLLAQQEQHTQQLAALQQQHQQALQQQQLALPTQPSRQTISANYSKLPVIAHEVYQAYRPDEMQLDCILAPAEMVYYSTALLWLKLLDVKAKQGRTSLTSAETDLQEATMEDKWNVPQPIYAYLSSVGHVKDKGGKTIDLEVPALPITRAGGFGGYHSTEVNEQTHNLFEEVPCLGIAADVIMALQPLNQGAPRQPNFRIGKPANTAFTKNLCCADLRPAYVRPEIIAKLQGQGINNESFAEFVPDTRFNLMYLRQISDLIGKMETFRNEAVNIPNLTSNGGESQIILTEPDGIVPAGKTWIQTSVIAKTAYAESTANVGAAYVFGFQLKKHDSEGDTNTAKSKNWSCIEPTEVGAKAVAWTMSPGWYNNINERRHLPPGIGSMRFIALGKPQDVVTEDVVRRMIKTKR